MGEAVGAVVVLCEGALLFGFFDMLLGSFCILMVRDGFTVVFFLEDFSRKLFSMF